MVANASTESPTPRTVARDNTEQPPDWVALLELAAPRPNLANLARLFHNSFDWPVLLQRAEDHGIVPLIAERVGNTSLDPTWLPANVRDSLREARRAQIVFTLRLTAELFRVLDRFAEARIEALVTKGPALSVRCYGEPGMRRYGDLDLVVREADIRRVTQAMLDLGYQPRVPLTAIDAKKMPGEYAFRKLGTDLLIEFHTERTFRYHPRRLPIEKLFERRASVVIDRRDVPALSLEDELVLICVHGAKHFWERLMWIADVAALISRQPLDWDHALAVANEVGAQRIPRLGLRLAADLLGAELPSQLAASVRSDRTVAKLAAQIESRLVHPELHEIGILQRAAFRVRMRDSLLPGLAYLLRLSLSPTEEDWTPGKEGERSAFMDAISRPFRLARKHSRPSSK
jgi:hypothetical protein